MGTCGNVCANDINKCVNNGSICRVNTNCIRNTITGRDG